MEAPLIQQQYPEVRSALKDRVAQFNTFANNHVEKQSFNPFSTDKQVSGIVKRRFSKEEYGRPVKGSQSEIRGFKATVVILKEMLDLCEILNANSEPLFTPEEKQDDPRKVISFGELFTIYTTISDKLVGMLLRTRKQKLVDFEGEVLFQRRDDHVPVILLKPIEEVRKILNSQIEAALSLLHNRESPIKELAHEQ